MATATTLSHLYVSSPITRFPRHRRLSFPSCPRKVSVVASVVGGGNGGLSYATDDPKKPHYEDVVLEQEVPQEEEIEEEDNGVSVPLNAYCGSAKIHDFCLGIPYGGIVLGGGVVGFIFSRNPTDVLFGGALLALSYFSLKVWRKGLSSLPFVLGQAVLSGLLFWKSFQAYSLTKKLIPSGIFAVISAAMLCFYSYVMISGGNPPPKKLQSSATVST